MWGKKELWELPGLQASKNSAHLGEMEDEILARLHKLAAVCAAQTNLATERSGLQVSHYFGLCLVMEEQLGELSLSLENLFQWLDQRVD